MTSLPNGKGRVLVGVLISGCAAAALVGCSSNSSRLPDQFGSARTNGHPDRDQDCDRIPVGQ